MGKRSREEREAGTSGTKKRRTDGETATKMTNGHSSEAALKGDNVAAVNGLHLDDVESSDAHDVTVVKEKKEKKKKKRKHDDVEPTDSGLGKDDTNVTNGTAPSSKTSGSYDQDPALSSLKDDEVDGFLNKNFISISGSDSKALRPILDFQYLPSDCRHSSLFSSFKEPTPVQGAAWPFLLSGRDVVGIAETGSGKTLAFGVPCVRHVQSKSKKKSSKIRAVLVSPTRELALQIHEQMEKLVQGTDVRVVCIYGGVGKDGQRTALAKSQIVIATPGRLMDFIQEGSADLGHVSYFVLDEADRMLEKGFEQDMRTIASAMPTGKVQTAMFTATWPASIRELAAQFMKDPVRIAIGDNPEGDLRANARVTQQVEVLDPNNKEQRLLQLLKQYQSGKQKTDRILVFCLYKKEAARIERFIGSRGHKVAGIHGDLSQEARTKALTSFRDGSVPLLVATDVAARGLDIPAVKVVINVTCEIALRSCPDCY